MIGDFNEDPYPTEYDEDDWPTGAPHDIKTSHITGDLKCRLCLVSYPLDEPCERPMAAFTSDNGTDWLVVHALYDTFGRSDLAGRTVLRFYDRAQAGKPGFNDKLGQYVADYFVDTILGLTSGLNLSGGVPQWWIDRDAMHEVVQWAQRVDADAHIMEG